MAHRTNVIQVLDRIELKKKDDVIDPTCKHKLSPKDSKFSVYHQDKTYYFCSKACRNKFVAEYTTKGRI